MIPKTTASEMIASTYLRFPRNAEDIRAKYNANGCTIHLVLILVLHHLTKKAAQILKQAEIWRREGTNDALNYHKRILGVNIIVLV